MFHAQITETVHGVVAALGAFFFVLDSFGFLPAIPFEFLNKIFAIFEDIQAWIGAPVIAAFVMVRIRRNAIHDRLHVFHDPDTSGGAVVVASLDGGHAVRHEVINELLASWVANGHANVFSAGHFLYFAGMFYSGNAGLYFVIFSIKVQFSVLANGTPKANEWVTRPEVDAPVSRPMVRYAERVYSMNVWSEGGVDKTRIDYPFAEILLAEVRIVSAKPCAGVFQFVKRKFRVGRYVPIKRFDAGMSLTAFFEQLKNPFGF